MANYEYKLGRSAGVLGLRPAGGALALVEANVVSQKFEGVAVNDGDVYRTSFVNGKTILTDLLSESNTTFWIATRINHPTQGNILFADSTNEIFINEDHILYTEALGLISYGGGDEVIDGTANGYRYTLADGTKVVAVEAIIAVPA
jgi:hypothetical protein